MAGRALTSQELEVIVLRYGLRSGRAMRLDAVGKVMELNTERVRYIDEHARAMIGHEVLRALSRILREGNDG